MNENFDINCKVDIDDILESIEIGNEDKIFSLIEIYLDSGDIFSYMERYTDGKKINWFVTKIDIEQAIERNDRMSIYLLVDKYLEQKRLER